MNVVTYSDNGLSPATTNYYRVRATNGGGDSGYSNTDSATTFDVPPAAPTRLIATAVSDSQIDLAWTDNSSNETGFKIERSPDGSTWAEIATVGTDVVTYSDTGLLPATMYYYRVRATNGSGESGYSNTAMAPTGGVVLGRLPGPPGSWRILRPAPLPKWGPRIWR